MGLMGEVLRILRKSRTSAGLLMLGMGLYLGYVPFNSILFDRMIATFKYVSTVGFLIYLADAFGYLGSIGVLLYKELGQPSLSWLEFFIHAGYIMSVSGSLLILGSMLYFHFKHRQWIKNTLA